jgi:putative sugar O-methyltransferase
LLQTKIGSRYFNQVDIMALNASLQIRNVLKGSHDKTILEIGAGCGVTAYWCTKLGLGPIQIVDLPHVAVLQAFYLLKVLPESNILLFGESHNLKTVDITIYPHLAFDQLPYQTSPRLVFNQDSFAEMSETVVKEYLKWIMKIEASFLLSINHESAATYNTLLVEQVILSKLIQLEPAFLPVYRHPNWVRMGYIDQLWRLR